MENKEPTKELVTQDFSISGLYYKYKQVEDEEIKSFLVKTQIAWLTNKGVNTVQGYYPLTDKSVAKILEGPRNTSLSFDAVETTDTPLTGLREFKRITYLVKSPSRFFLKPDIGEIIDQITFADYRGEINAIVFEEGYEELPDTDGEHFLKTAILLVKENMWSRHMGHHGWVSTKFKE